MNAYKYVKSLWKDILWNSKLLQKNLN
jgi:hypothetical protein